MNCVTRRPEVSPHLRALAAQALECYGLEAASFEYISDTDNDVFRVDHGDRVYALRLQWLDDNDREGVESELRWLHAIRQETRIVAPLPVATSSGSWVVELQDDENEQSRPCSLLEWVEGEPVDAGLTSGHLRKVGDLMARLHDHAASCAQSLQLDTRRIAYQCDLSAIAHNERARLWFDDDALTLIEQGAHAVATFLEALDRHPAYYGFIHADLHHWNYLFHHDEIRVIDFSDAGWGHFAYDIAVTLSALEYPLPGLHDHRGSYAALREAFLEGYHHVRDLPRDWPDEVDTYVVARLLFMTEIMLTYWWTADDPDWGKAYVQQLPGILSAYLADSC